MASLFSIVMVQLALAAAILICQWVLIDGFVLSTPIKRVVYLDTSYREASSTTTTSEDDVVDTSADAPTIISNTVCETIGITLKEFMGEICLLNPELKELGSMFGAIETACKAISYEVRRSQLPPPNADLLDFQETKSDKGKDLEKRTMNLLKKALRFTGRLGALASEEEEGVVGQVSDNVGKKEIVIDEGEEYVVVVNPLDGSSNVEAGIPTGTIFGVYKYDDACVLEAEECPVDSDEGDALCLACTLQPGENLVASAYCLYSSSASLMLTIGSGTYGFILDENLGEFILTNPSIKIPPTSNTLSFNEARIAGWDVPLQSVVSRWKVGHGKSEKVFTSRYIGSMVADVHRTLLCGGVFGYPADNLNPNGKLRLLYELAPVAFLVEQAGGLATTGTQRVMEVIPDRAHQRLPAVMGSKDDVNEVVEAYENWETR